MALPELATEKIPVNSLALALAGSAVDDTHHIDNQRSFIAMEAKIDKNTLVTEKLAADTSDLLAMWRDVSFCPGARNRKPSTVPGLFS